MINKSTLERVISEDLSELWSTLSSDDKHLIVDNFTTHTFKKNQIIYAEKEMPEHLWCLLKGKVKLYKDGIGGRQQILRLIRPVQYFGYRAYFAEEPYVSTAAAFEPSTLGCLPMSLVQQLIQNNVKLAWFFIKELSRNLGGSDTKIVNLTQKHIRGRLAETLLMLTDEYGTETDEGKLCLSLNREDLACFSNMTTSNAIRTLSAFASEGLIEIYRRNIKILNKEELIEISRMG